MDKKKQERLLRSLDAFMKELGKTSINLIVDEDNNIKASVEEKVSDKNNY